MIRLNVELCTCRPESLLAGLLPCPFCGGAAVMEPYPECGDVVRIACASEACLVMPRTGYLLVAYADELRSAWNVRAGTGGDGPHR